MQRFEDLEVFQRSYKLSLKVHKLSLEFPKIEPMHGLADQMCRASKGICANIAEGHGKLIISRVWLRYCLDLNYIDDQQWKYLKTEYSQISKMLVSLHKSFK